MINTKIVATLGPASKDLKTVRQLIKGGMDVARLNFSHGTYKDHRDLILILRKAAKLEKKTIAIMQDLQGPRIRVGIVAEEGIDLVRNKIVTLIFGAKESTSKDIIPIDLPVVPELEIGSSILIHDGIIDLKVEAVKGQDVKCRVLRGGIVFTHKGVNIPYNKINAPVITDKDRADLKFGMQQGIDWVAISFVGQATDVKKLRKLITRYDKTANIKIMSKIERPEAVNNIDKIINVSDGIMIARGDLGVEVSPQRVPIIQKDIIQRCMAVSKPVLVATQMLDSMIKSQVPTRAEVSDVANAVIDHTDAVMLSGETAFGLYPVESIQMMNKIIVETEMSPFDDRVDLLYPPKKDSHYRAVADTIFDLVRDSNAKAIVVLSRSGFSVQLVASQRPHTKIIALVADDKIRNQLNMVWGVQAYKIAVKKNLDELISQAISLVIKQKIVRKGQNVVFVSGQPVGKSQHANMVEVYKI